jgi:hypothetical protein
MNEFLLPMPGDSRLFVGEWLAEFRQDSSDDARKRLESYWEPIKTLGFRRLAAQLLDSDKFGMVEYSSGFLFGQKEGVDGRSIGDRWYLPSRNTSIDFSKLVEDVDHLPHGELCEFLTYFGGLRDDLDYSGAFIYLPPWERFSNELASEFNFEIEGFGDWENSIMLYKALDGSVALVREDNSVGFWMPAELRVKLTHKSLGQFIAVYANARIGGRPFCGYSIE